MSDAGAEYLIPRERVERILLVPPDPTWPQRYSAEERVIRTAVGDALVDVHHAGSTSVPGLYAKPVIDVVLLVVDSTDEDRYVPPLERVGYAFHVRERDWYEHRLLKKEMPNQALPNGSLKANLHVFTDGCEEAARMLAFRDWLRAHEQDRVLYQRTKQGLAERRWDHVQQYADAKSQVVADIMSRAWPTDRP